MDVGKILNKSALTYPDNLAVAYGTRKVNYTQFSARATARQIPYTGWASDQLTDADVHPFNLMICAP